MATRILHLANRMNWPRTRDLQSISKFSVSPKVCKDAQKTNDEALWKRSSYKYFLPIQTRWSDNDQYGHVNNIMYYSYFDSVINHYLINFCELNTNVCTSEIVGYMVDTRCTFRQPISFPEIALAGLAISRIGRSSVEYSVAIFAEKDSNQHATSQESGTDYPNHHETACAIGQCTHVFVDTCTNRPIGLPDKMREALEKISLQTPNSKL